MTSTALVLIESKQAENAETTQYTSPTGTRTLIDKFTGTNTTASPATLTVRLLPQGGTPGAANLIVVKTLSAGETYTFPELVAHSLAPGGFISTLAGTAAAITIRSSGRQIS